MSLRPRAWVCENRFVEWGAGIADFDNDGWQDLMYMTGNVYPEIEQRLPRYPHEGPRMLFLNRGDGRFDRRPTRRPRPHDASLEPRRGLR